MAFDDSWEIGFAIFSSIFMEFFHLVSCVGKFVGVNVIHYN